MTLQTGVLVEPTPTSLLPSGPRTVRRVGRAARKYPLGLFGLFLVMVVLLLAVFGPTLTPNATRISSARMKNPSAAHWFGTDNLGRDYFARVVAGARLSLSLALSAMAIGTLSAVAIGMVSAYAGGAFDLLVQRLVDMMLAFPGLILLLLIGQVLGHGWQSVALGLGVLFSVGLSRIIRANTLSTLTRSYVESARVVGASPKRILVRHVLPNMGPPLLVYITALVGGAILAEGGLAFLGLGIAPPAPSWGRMLSEARAQWRFPYLSIFPGLAMTIAVLGFNLLGDALRDIFDPRLRGS